MAYYIKKQQLRGVQSESNELILKAIIFYWNSENRKKTKISRVLLAFKQARKDHCPKTFFHIKNK